MNIRYLTLVCLTLNTLTIGAAQTSSFLPPLHTQEYIYDGVTYQHYLRTADDGAEPLVVHATIIDPTYVEIHLVGAGSTGCSREEVSSIAQRTGALVACNGGHYRRGGPFNGNPLGLVILDGNVASDPGLPHPCIYWHAGGKTVLFGRGYMNYTLTIDPDLGITIDRINQPRQHDENVLYDSSFGHATTRTPTWGHELTLLFPSLLNATVAKVRFDKGNSLIPSAQTRIAAAGILSCGPSSDVYEQITYALKGRSCALHYEPTLLEGPYGYADTAGMVTAADRSMYALGAGPLLVTQGVVRNDFVEQMPGGKPLATFGDEVIIDFSVEAQRTPFLFLRHPRTAVGVTQEGLWILVAVEGRYAGSVGATCQELAHIMHELGCQNAINIGGGGCTTLYVDGAVVNHCSGDSISVAKERPVSEAFVVVPRR